MKNAIYLAGSLFLLAGLMASGMFFYNYHQLKQLYSRLDRVDVALNDSRARINEVLEKQTPASTQTFVKSQSASIKYNPYAFPRDDLKHVLGDPAAPITVNLFADHDCTYCKQFFPQIITLISQATLKKINLVYHHFPLSIHEPSATIHAKFAECSAIVAGNPTFWSVSMQMFQAANTDTESLINQFNLPPQEFKSCITGSDAMRQINTDLELGHALSISSTPTLVIVDNKTGNKVKVEGVISPSELSQALAQLHENQQSN